MKNLPPLERKVKVRVRAIYEATQYLKRGDHLNEHVWSVAIPILGEEDGKRWPESGRLGTLDECNPDDVRYAIFATAERKQDDYFQINLGWWILELHGRVVAVKPPEVFTRDFETVS